MSMNIEIEETIKDRLKKYLDELPEAGYLAVRLSTDGCHGWTFEIKPEKAKVPNDTLFEVDGIRFGVQEKHSSLLNGMQIKLQKQGLSEIVIFESPDIVSRCGCGTSVQLKER